jgi:arylsulfatase A-like enzyme
MRQKVIVDDQQHWQALGFEDPFFETPTLDSLAAKSIVFQNSFCTTPQCSPSRSSLLTGFYPTKTGVLGNIRAAGGTPLKQPTIATELQSRGYLKGYFGKWHLGDETSATNGWDERNFESNDVSTEARVVDFLKRSTQSNKSFALFVSFLNPHDIYHFMRDDNGTAGNIPLPYSWDKETFTYKPPIHKQFMLEDQGRVIWNKERSVWEKYRDFYHKKNKLYDKRVCVLLQEIETLDLVNNTIVIVTSDHGDMDTNHKLIYKGPFMYEHMVRVPLIVYVPQRLQGTKAKCITSIDVSGVDIVPTIRDLCGITMKECDGLSLKPILTNSKGQRERDFVIGQYYSKQKWVNPIRMIRTKEFKLNRYNHYGDEFYDLKNDPHELKNLATDHNYSSMKRELTRELNRWIEQNNDPFYSFKATTRSGEIIA